MAEMYWTSHTQVVAIEGAAVPELVKLKQERDVKLAEDPGAEMKDLYLDVAKK